ncbi:MAG: DUF2147 domain-containing protein [Rubrivivax sp.]|nr:MAG: DUF2147 domain-containing protein [Rubrivivax sp.]
MNKPPLERSLALAAALLWLSHTASWAQPATDQTAPRGHWITASGNLEVNIAPCADQAPTSPQPALCGTVIRVMANHSMTQGGSDMKPVDARPALGMQILSGFQPAPDGAPQWDGEIYNRENGKTYSCRMSLDGQGGLVLHAYVGLPLFGKTQVWRRP